MSVIKAVLLASANAPVVPAATEVSTVAVTAAVVVLFPATSIAFAVKLCAPSPITAVVKVQLPPFKVASPNFVTPS